jgi:reversibly glycosylated polypeptide / UDP-arabinopyranose mutase
MIAVIIPTIRPEKFKLWLEKWTPLIKKHNAQLVTVFDGDNPQVLHNGNKYSVTEIMEEYKDVIFNRTAACRNLGFAYAYKYLNPDIYITLDDDEDPINDSIQDHLDALNMRVPVSWISTASGYMRGFPYAVRDEAEVVLSHGVWENVPDLDAPTQLHYKGEQFEFYKGAIPKGIYYPMSSMNLAFKSCVLPFIYHAPMGKDIGFDRFDDIWSGIVSKREIDKNGWAVVSGYSRVHHQRASNVFENLIKEAKGLKLNETFWQGDESDQYFKLYRDKLARWQEFLK